MGEFVKGNVVVLPFPFSDLSSSKRRPALVVARLEGDDLILCQITTAARFDKYAVELEKEDFKDGSLTISSLIRPNRLFTADKSIVNYRAGSLKDEKMKEVSDALCKIIKGPV